MKRKALALTFILAFLISAMAGTKLVNRTKANPYGEELDYTALPVITINSPINDTTLFRDNVSLSITVKKPGGWLIRWGDARQMLKSISYQLDGEIYGPFMANSYLESPFNYSINLPNLEIGVHSLKVYADATGWLIEMHSLWQNEVSITASSDTVCFTVENDVPKVEVMTIKNFTTSDIPLDISINVPTSKITYSLDNQENVTIARNTTLTGLSNGFHNVTVYAWDATGNVGASEAVTFRVDVPEPFQTALIAAASGASAAVVCLGLLVYFRKCKH